MGNCVTFIENRLLNVDAAEAVGYFVSGEFSLQYRCQLLTNTYFIALSAIIIGNINAQKHLDWRTASNEL